MGVGRVKMQPLLVSSNRLAGSSSTWPGALAQVSGSEVYTVSAPGAVIVHFTMLGVVVPALCVAAALKLGVSSRWRPTIVKLCTIAVFGTELPGAGCTLLIVSASGALAVPQLGFASELLQPQIASAQPIKIPNRPELPFHMRALSS